MGWIVNINKKLELKMLEIFYRLRVKADNISLTVGPTLYFIGKYIWIYYLYKLVICILAFGHYRDL
jgi:hypothetical protein